MIQNSYMRSKKKMVDTYIQYLTRDNWPRNMIKLIYIEESMRDKIKEKPRRRILPEERRSLRIKTRRNNLNM